MSLVRQVQVQQDTVRILRNENARLKSENESLRDVSQKFASAHWYDGLRVGVVSTGLGAMALIVLIIAFGAN